MTIALRRQDRGGIVYVPRRDMCASFIGLIKVLLHINRGTTTNCHPLIITVKVYISLLNDCNFSTFER
jgi:hypothetical protein